MKTKQRTRAAPVSAAPLRGELPGDLRYTLRQAAERIRSLTGKSCGYSNVQRLIRSGRLKTELFGKSHVVTEAMIQGLIAEGDLRKKRRIRVLRLDVTSLRRAAPERYRRVSESLIAGGYTQAQVPLVVLLAGLRDLDEVLGSDDEEGIDGYLRSIGAPEPS